MRVLAAPETTAYLSRQDYLPAVIEKPSQVPTPVALERWTRAQAAVFVPDQDTGLKPMLLDMMVNLGGAGAGRVALTSVTGNRTGDEQVYAHHFQPTAPGVRAMVDPGELPGVAEFLDEPMVVGGQLTLGTFQSSGRASREVHGLWVGQPFTHTADRHYKVAVLAFDATAGGQGEEVNVPGLVRVGGAGAYARGAVGHSSVHQVEELHHPLITGRAWQHEEVARMAVQASGGDTPRGFAEVNFPSGQKLTVPGQVVYAGCSVHSVRERGWELTFKKPIVLDVAPGETVESLPFLQF